MANLILNVDYYIENGAWVFTEHFLLARGYCCGSGCRHCPYKSSQNAVNSSNPPAPNPSEDE